MIELQGRVAVVTGASSGLGRRIALDLAARGAVVTALARRRDRLEELAAAMVGRSSSSGVVACDVSETDEFERVLREVEADRGRIDVLVNNAGIPEPPGEGLEPYRKVMETNFFAAVAGTLAVLPGMTARGDGDIVNVSSDAGRAPIPGEPGYSASKAALSAFSEAVSFEAERAGVRVHVLYPGWVPTEMTREADGKLPERLPPRFVRRTDAEVSQLVIDRLGRRRFEIDATLVARVAPLAKTLFPTAYRRGVAKFS
jgi:NAD(P)-dependent dehydrogenase (short-subunit alcohol dehydrogenase family)